MATAAESTDSISLAAPAADTGEESVLARLPWILSLAAVILVILVYPLRLEDTRLLPLVRGWESRAEAGSAAARLALDQFESYVGFYHSPLILKGLLAAWCAMAAIAAMAAGRLLAPRAEAAPARASFRFALWPVFLGWCGLSILWSPTPELSREGLVWIAAFGGLGYALLLRGVSRDEARQLGALLMALGAVVALGSLAQLVSLIENFRIERLGVDYANPFRNLYFRYFLKFDDRRNVLGSFMGHNTEVASFLLMGAFPAMAFAVDAKTLFRRLLARLWLALALIVILIVQSRAVWLMIPPLFAAFIWIAARERGAAWLRRLTAYVLAAVLLALASQTVSAPWNIFYRRDNPLAARLQDLSLDGLRRETRTRILVCSASLIAERPWLGAGLYAFQYVYPKAQAEYFALHPETRIEPTKRRSNMAHNEYLQTLIEQGAIGLMLMLAALAEPFWRGRRARAPMQPNDRLLHLAFGCSFAMLLLHSLVHFPLHVPQLAVPWLLCVAAFASPRSNSEEGEPFPDSVPSAPPPPAEPAFASRVLCLRRVSSLVMGCSILLLAPLAAVPLVRALRADVDFCYGSVQAAILRQGGISRATADRIWRVGTMRMKRAIRTQPSHDQARYMLGELYYYQGVALARQSRELDRNFASPDFSAVHALNDGISYLSDSLRSLRYHGTYYMMALCYQALIDVLPRQESEAPRRAYLQNLELAVYYGPSFVEAINLLAEWIAVEPGANPERIVRLRRAVYRYDPTFFDQKYVLRVDRKIIERDFGTAVGGAEALVAVDPTNPVFLTAAMDARMMAGGDANRARAVELARALRAAPHDPASGMLHPYYYTYAALYEPLVLDDWTRVLDRVGHFGGELPELRGILASIDAHAREKTNLAGLPPSFPKPRAMPEADWAAYLAQGKAMALHRWIGEPAAALQAYRAAVDTPGPAPSLNFWIDAAELAAAQRDRSLFDLAMERIRAREPKHPALSRLAPLAPGETVPPAAPSEGSPPPE